MKYLAFILVTLAVITLSPASAAETPEKLFSFAKGLYDSRNYYEAHLEFKRLLSYYPSSSLAKESSFMIGMSYLKAGKNMEAADAFNTYISNFPKDEKAKEALVNIAKSYYKSGRFLAGVNKLSDIKSQAGDERLSDLSDYLMGWGYLGDHLFDESSSVFYYIGTREGEYKDNAGWLASEIKSAQPLPSKSPALAGIMSALIPGSGQVYAERYYDGLVSFVLNAAFLYLAVEGYNSGNNSTGLFFSVIELGWYSGNIYSAVRSAHKYNEEKADEFVSGLQIKYGFQF
jgi:tetratricopeptide (TPR) repeat protein